VKPPNRTPQHALHQLSKRCRRLLEHGEGWERYDSTHKALAALVGGMYRAGWSEQQALEACLDESLAASRRLSAKYRGGLVSQVQSKWRAAVRRHHKHADLCEQWSQELLSGWPFGGQYRAALRVGLALGELAALTGSLSFTASQRSICAAAGVGYASPSGADTKTLRRAVKQLAAWGLIEISYDEPTSKRSALLDANVRYTLPPPDGLRERLCELCIPDPSKHPSDASCWIRGVMPAHLQALHTVFEEAALGMSACRIWHVLIGEGALSPHEIASKLRLSLRCVHNAIGRLSEARLIEQPKAGQPWHALSRSLDDVAEELGVDMREQWRRSAFVQQTLQRRAALQSPLQPSRVVDYVTGEIIRNDSNIRPEREVPPHPFPTKEVRHHDENELQPPATPEARHLDQVRQLSAA